MSQFYFFNVTKRRHMQERYVLVKLFVFQQIKAVLRSGGLRKRTKYHLKISLSMKIRNVLFLRV